MFSDRVKTVLWLGLFKSLHPCLATRRDPWAVESSSPSFVKLGRLDFHWGSSRSRQQDDHYNGLALPDSAQPIATSAWTDPNMIVRPVSVRTKVRKKAPAVEEKEEVEEESLLSTAELSIRVSDPIISDSAWEQMTGHEFEDPETVDRLARTGLEMATKVAKNNWIQWTAHKDTEKLLHDKDEMSALQDGDVLMYVGKAKKEGFGSKLPLVKSKSILPLSAKAMADLLMDSTQVKTYNKLSVGRTDVKLLDENTKIVCNLTKPPIAKSKMASITLMHARPLGEQDADLLPNHREGYLVVSRAVPGLIDKELEDLPRNDILLGVNILQDIGPDQCMMTAVTHVYSPALPKMLAKSMGVSSAMNFVREIREACAAVSN